MGGRSKKKLLMAARGVFARSGFHATHISDIVEAAGVARGTFYLHFQSKKEVFEAVLQEAMRTLLASVDGVDTSKEVTSMQLQLQQTIERFFDTAVSERDSTIILVREAPNAGMIAQVQNFYQNLLQYIETSIQNGQKLGWVRSIQPQAAALCVLGAVRQVLEGFLSSDEPNYDEQMAQTSRTLVDFALHGIAN